MRNRKSRQQWDDVGNLLGGEETLSARDSIPDKSSLREGRQRGRWLAEGSGTVLAELSHPQRYRKLLSLKAKAPWIFRKEPRTLEMLNGGTLKRLPFPLLISLKCRWLFKATGVKL